MTQEEYKEKLYELEKEVDKIWRETFDIPDYKEAMKYYRNHPTVKEYGRLWREYKLIKDYTLDDIPDYGQLYTLDEFVSFCDNGPMFSDYDGTGYYATKDKMSDITISPSDILEGIYRKDFTHVMWFNK